MWTSSSGRMRSIIQVFVLMASMLPAISALSQMYCSNQNTGSDYLAGKSIWSQASFESSTLTRISAKWFPIKWCLPANLSRFLCLWYSTESEMLVFQLRSRQHSPYRTMQSTLLRFPPGKLWLRSLGLVWISGSHHHSIRNCQWASVTELFGQLEESISIMFLPIKLFLFVSFLAGSSLLISFFPPNFLRVKFRLQLSRGSLRLFW